MSDTKLAVGTAVNVLFWREVAGSILGRKYSWIGVAGSLAAMVSAKEAKGPVVPLLNLPGNIAANVLGLKGCGCKDDPTGSDEIREPSSGETVIIDTDGESFDTDALREQIREQVGNARGL